MLASTLAWWLLEQSGARARGAAIKVMNGLNETIRHGRGSLIHRATKGHVSFSVRDPMNSPMWPPGPFLHDPLFRRADQFCRVQHLLGRRDVVASPASR